MRARRLDEARIENDGRLLLIVKRTRLTVALNAQLTELAMEVDQPMPSRATAAGDVAKLRGIPAIGRGVPGATRGSRPDTAYMAETVVYALSVLGQDIDGTSPGTQPEQALMDKEDAA